MSPEFVEKIVGFGFEYFPGEVIISLLVMIIIMILSFVIYFVFRKLDPTKPNKGFSMIVEFGVDKLESFTVDIMGERWRKFSGYILGLALYIFFACIMETFPLARVSLKVVSLS